MKLDHKPYRLIESIIITPFIDVLAEFVILEACKNQSAKRWLLVIIYIFENLSRKSAKINKMIINLSESNEVT